MHGLRVWSNIGSCSVSKVLASPASSNPYWQRKLDRRQHGSFHWSEVCLESKSLSLSMGCIYYAWIKNTVISCWMNTSIKMNSVGKCSPPVWLSPSMYFIWFFYAAVNVVLMRRGNSKLDPSTYPIRLMNMQRHSPSILTSLSGRWLHSLTRACWEDG